MGPEKQSQDGFTHSNASLEGRVLDAPFNGPMQPEGHTPTPIISAVDQGSLLDEAGFDNSPEVSIVPTRRNIRRILALGVMGFGLIAAVLVGVRIEANKSKSPVLDEAQKVKSQTVSLSGLSQQLGTVSSQLNTLTVNGQLAVNDSISLLPTTKPQNATVGELYYDQATNQLGYYNGSGFVYVQGGASSSVINNVTTNNITNVTNIIGSSGTVTGNGTAGTLAFFTSGSNIQSSILSQSGTAVSVAGSLNLRSVANSTAAFQVQSATGNSLLTADTTNNALVLGNDGTVGAVTIRGGQAVGSNLSGATITFAGTNGTGSANGGDIVFETGQTPQGGIQFDNTAKTAQNGTTISMSYTTSTQRSRLLIVTLDWSSTSVTYDGRALTLLGSVNSGKHYGGGVNIYMWYLVNPPSGTFTLSALNGATGSTIGAASYYNVNQTTPFGTVVTGTGNLSGTQSSTLAVTTTSTSQAVVDDFGVDTTTGTCVPNSGQTLRWSIVQSFFPVVCGGDIVATGGSMTQKWSVTSADWGEVAAPINPAVPGSAPMQSPTPTTPDTLYDRLHITSTGNIGIDNSNPQYALDVGGVINASTAVYAPVLDTVSSAVLDIGNFNASSIQIGNTTSNIATSIIGTAVIKPTPGNDSTSDFQIQNASSVALFSADTTNMGIAISGTSSKFATLTLSNAHVNAAQTTAPTISAPLNCGTGATASVTAGSTDTTGSYTIHAGTGTPTTCDVTLSFNGAYGAAPNVVLTPSAVGGAAAPLPSWVSAASTTSFTAQIAPSNAAASGVYSYYYWVAQ